MTWTATAQFRRLHPTESPLATPQPARQRSVPGQWTPGERVLRRLRRRRRTARYLSQLPWCRYLRTDEWRPRIQHRCGFLPHSRNRDSRHGPATSGNPSCGQRPPLTWYGRASSTADVSLRLPSSIRMEVCQHTWLTRSSFYICDSSLAMCVDTPRFGITRQLRKTARRGRPGASGSCPCEGFREQRRRGAHHPRAGRRGGR